MAFEEGKVGLTQIGCHWQNIRLVLADEIFQLNIRYCNVISGAAPTNCLIDSVNLNDYKSLQHTAGKHVHFKIPVNKRNGLTNYCLCNTVLGHCGCPH